MSYMSMIMQGAGSMVQMAGTALSWEAQKTTSKYNKSILDSNAMIDTAINEAAIRRIREEGEGILAEQRVAIAKSGTTFSGSNIDVFMKSLKNIELDVINMKINDSIRQAGVEQQKAQIDVDLRRAKASAILSQVASGLQTTSSIAQQQKVQPKASSGAAVGSQISTAYGGGVVTGVRTGMSSRG